MSHYQDVLVTGGDGFVGRNLQAYLPGATFLSRQDVDLCDGNALRAWLAAHATADWPAVVVHLAARVGGIRANLAKPADFLLDNLRLDAHVCSAVRQLRPRHFIPLLSSCMYPDKLADADYPMLEAQFEAGPPPPSNAAYAAAKRALWHATQAMHQQDGIGYTCLIPANLYGPHDHFHSQESHFLAAAITRLETARQQAAAQVTFWGHGTAMRQYVYVADLAWLIRSCIAHGPFNTSFNVAPQAQHSIAQLAEAVRCAAGYDGRLVFSGEGPDGQHRKDVSSAHLRQHLPAWATQETSLAQGLQQSLQWYRSQAAHRTPTHSNSLANSVQAESPGA